MPEATPPMWEASAGRVVQVCWDWGTLRGLNAGFVRVLIGAFQRVLVRECFFEFKTDRSPRWTFGGEFLLFLDRTVVFSGRLRIRHHLGCLA